MFFNQLIRGQILSTKVRVNGICSKYLLTSPKAARNFGHFRPLAEATFSHDVVISRRTERTPTSANVMVGNLFGELLYCGKMKVKG